MARVETEGFATTFVNSLKERHPKEGLIIDLCLKTFDIKKNLNKSFGYLTKKIASKGGMAHKMLR
ncbi:MAG: hypothetical protein HA490_07140 [Archaeoglobales archaeon]|nr:hypothetical protein [Archaeoglobales archaeon]